MQFSEPVANGVTANLRTATGDRIDLGSRRATQSGLVAQYDVPPLHDGVYTVSWRVLALDGHLSVGEFAFGIGSSPGQIPSATGEFSTGGSWPGTASHWVFILALLAAFGGLIAERLVRAPSESDEMAFPAGWLLALSLAGALGQLVADLLSSPQPTTLAGLLVQRPIDIALIEILGVAYGWWLLALRGTRPLAMVPLVFAVLAAALAGHPGTFDPWWAAVANSVHLLAVSTWLGGLFYVSLFSLRRREGLREAARRYSRFALWAALVSVLSGLLVAFAELGSLRDLLDSWYGRVLDAKAAVVGLALLLALLGRRELRRRAAGANLLGLSRLVRAEGVMLVIVIIIATLLASLPAPRGLRPATDLLGAAFPDDGYYQAGLAGNLAIDLVATTRGLQVRVVTPSGTSEGSRIAITGRSPDGTSVSFFPVGCGPGCTRTAFDWSPGTTVIQVDAQALHWRGGRTEFNVDWPPPPSGQATLDKVVATMRGMPRVDFVEHVTSGPGSDATTTDSMTGEQFVAQELYAGGGSTGVRASMAKGREIITLFVQGSSIWYSLEVQGGRIEREQIVSPGHLIIRDFRNAP